MGTKKQPKKQRKQLQKKARKARAVKEKHQKRIDALKEEKRLLALRVANLQRQLKEVSESRHGPETPDEQPGKVAASNHRIAWERYAYLHDRYEACIEKGANKEDARKMANKDLLERFGKEAGYTEQQLECIFL